MRDSFKDKVAQRPMPSPPIAISSGIVTVENL
jgi:hypothetical protein